MKSFVWKVQRMQMMSPAEMGVRAGREVRNLVEYLLLASGARRSSFEAGGDALTGGPFFRAKFFFEPEDERLRLESSQASALLEEAAAAVAHRVPVLGHQYDLGARIDWHFDYRLNRRCPVRYWSLIDLKNPDFEESIRWVWYLNRHKHLGVLGRAYSVSGNKEFAQEIVDQLCGWTEQNPPEVGVNWAASLEIALRLLSWLWALYPLRDFDGLTPKAQRAVMESVELQMRHMFRNLSTFSSANNHLIAQGMTLFLVGTLLPWMRGAARWKEKGLSILWSELLTQTFTDGVSREQSLHYHCFVVEMYSVVLLFARRNGIQVPERVRERFSGMCEFLLDVSTREGKMPDVGDSDDQTVMLSESPRVLLRCLMACGAYLTENEDFFGRVYEVPHDLAFLLGGEGSEFVKKGSHSARAEASRGEARSSKAFSESGYYVLSGEKGGVETRCVFDCGELGLGTTAAHGHADCLSVTLDSGGREILIDPGTFTYHSLPEWRAYFRSTSAHNTVNIDGQSQADMVGPFVWRSRATPRLEDLALESCFDLVAGSHDGYMRLADPVSIRRVLVFVKPSFLIIVDELSARGRHEYEQNFHFGGSVSLDRAAGAARVLDGSEGATALLFSPSIAGGRATLVSGREEPVPLGWRSPRFWEKTPCDCLSIRGHFSGLLVLDSCVVSTLADGAGEPAVSFSDLGGEARRHSMVRRRTSLFEETSLINLGDGWVRGEHLESDASYVCLREYTAGGREIFGRNVGNVLRDGESLLESSARFPFIRVMVEGEAVKFEAKGSGSVLVRADSAGSIVSSTPGVDYEKKGRFVRVSVEN
ncbi:MAG: alginate lyase family protein [Candidatus Eiseniibacteriota bacterium]|nr:MAG: alginate lyase family protein [Candidatus Eisenbacteria bacterium]